MRLLLISLTLSLTAAAANANNSFGVLKAVREGSSFYDVRLVRTLTNAVVQIQTWDGEVLGSREVEAGTRTNLRVRIGPKRIPPTDVFAVLLIDGEIADRDRIRVFKSR
ncbi:MAG: hypothetical protein AAGA47_03660 [Pseudomonadota bacterium]